MRLKQALVPLALAATVAGSGEILPEAGAAAKNLRPNTEEQSPMQKTLNEFRNDVLLKHQARIMLGTCVAWPNDGAGTTVTLNPGLAESGGDEFYIFSFHDPRYRPDWGPLNGPELLSADADLVIMTTDIAIDAKHPRKLSSREMEDSTGQRYFEDLKTKQPVMDTVLVPRRLSMSGITAVCAMLKNHKPILIPPAKAKKPA